MVKYFLIIGVYTYPNNDKYEGEWKDDQRTNKGIWYSKFRNHSLWKWE